MIWGYIERRLFRGLVVGLVRHGVPFPHAVQLSAACYPSGAANAATVDGFTLMRSRLTRTQSHAFADRLFAMRANQPELVLYAHQMLVAIYGEESVVEWFNRDVMGGVGEERGALGGSNGATQPRRQQSNDQDCSHQPVNGSNARSKPASEPSRTRFPEYAGLAYRHLKSGAAGVLLIVAYIVLGPFTLRPSSVVWSDASRITDGRNPEATGRQPRGSALEVRNTIEPVSYRVSGPSHGAGHAVVPQRVQPEKVTPRNKATQTEAELRRAVVEATEALRVKDYRRTLGILQPLMSDTQPQQLRDSIIWGRALRLMHDAHSERLSGVAGLQAVDDRVTGMQEIAVLRHRLMKNALARGQQEEARSFYRDADTLYNEVLAEADSAVAYGKSGSRLRQAVALALENKATMRVQLARRLHGLALWQEAEELLVDCTKFHQNHLDLPKADLERVAKKLQTLRIERKS